METAASAEEVGLLAHIGRGDREALRVLYGRYSGPLMSLAVRMVGDVGTAEELLQDVFVKVWRHAANYDPRKSRPFTWAVTIMRRTCIDHLRKRKDFAAASTQRSDTEVPNAYPSPENVRPAVQAREDLQRVDAALDDFPAEQRAALELALYSELTHVEIAARLGVPLGTIKTWVRRGLQELRTTLTDSPL
ncbi:MAG: sigma-70 family RNA polymerase sigma factor [Opitutus sp.]